MTSRTFLNSSLSHFAPIHTKARKREKPASLGRLEDAARGARQTAARLDTAGLWELLETTVAMTPAQAEVLARLIRAELAYRSGASTPTLLRFESARQQTATIVAKILAVCFPDARAAVDLTPGHGAFWREDVPTHVTVTLSSHDFRRLPYANESYCVALFDPPHNADAGSGSIMGTRFGTYKQADLEPAVRQGVREAWRVSTRGVLVKVTDHVHGQRFVRMSGWVYDELGEPFEVVHQVRGRALVDPRWREPQLSARNNGASYLIFRKDGPLHRRRKEDGNG